MDANIKVAELGASRGAGWIAEAFKLFRKAPFPWIALCSAWILITLALLILPLVGQAIANFLQPVFFASFAIAAYKQAAGERVLMADLFAGFRRNLRALVNLGVLILVAVLAIIFAMGLLGLPVMAPSGGDAATIDEYLESLRGKEWLVAATFLAIVVVKSAVWFAPPLIAFHGMSAFEAIRWSVYAAISNLGALIVYGAILFAIFFVAFIPWGLGLVVAIPVMAISSYTGYREVFEAAP
ncbi:MAG TPA: BPSS1780 family membrane protein [Usitatibacter sp.]